MSDKMLTFKEFRSTPIVFETEEKYWKTVFDLCRQGMIPAENAVVIPDVSEWPDDGDGRSATAFVVTGFFTWVTSKERQIEMLDKRIDEKFISWIPRPKPVWVPMVGEAVFLLWDSIDCPSVQVGKLVRVNGSNAQVIVDGVERAWGLANVKPFHESHIGKPWSEIPGGVE